MIPREAKKQLAAAQSALDSAMAARDVADAAVQEARRYLDRLQLEADRAKPLGKLARNTLTSMADGPLRFVIGMQWRAVTCKEMRAANELERIGFATYARTDMHQYEITDLGREKLAKETR